MPSWYSCWALADRNAGGGGSSYSGKSGEEVAGEEGWPSLNCKRERRWRIRGRRADWMFVAKAMRGAGKKVGSRNWPKPKASGLNQSVSRSRIAEFDDPGVFSHKEEAVTPNEMVAGVGGEPNNLPLHSKWAAVMV